MTISDPVRTLSQAYILGGSPCSGKSTIAARLSREYQLDYYKVDDHEREHLNRCDPDRHPVMHRLATMSWDEIWMRPVAEQVEGELAYYRERFEMIVQDLAAYPLAKPLILEGAAFLPELIEQQGADPQRVIFLVPTREFQLHHYRQRPWTQSILSECKDPDLAFENWMRRDQLFGQTVLRQAKARNYATILVDGKLSIDEKYEQVKEFLGLGR
jgi:2-phosphoglycerate kinase